MLDSVLVKAEENVSCWKIIFISFFFTIVLGFINSLIGNNSLFLIAFVSLALAVPIERYVKSMNQEELVKRMNSSTLIYRHEKELLVFWSIFIGSVIGFYSLFLFGINLDFSYQQTTLNQITGNIINTDYLFAEIFLNNFTVAMLTFLISIIVFSGLIFVLILNASMLTYYLYSFGSHKTALFMGFLLFAHGLLEIGGYIFAGIAGALISYKISKKTHSKYELNEYFTKDFVILILLSIVFLCTGALIESF